jgi:hypothetical protein
MAASDSGGTRGVKSEESGRLMILGIVEPIMGVLTVRIKPRV